MPFVIVTQHKVEDYDKWKTEFNSGIDMRKEAGEKAYQIFHTDDDPNNLAILFEWDNLDNARKFMESNELREKMQKGGVIGKPEIHFLEEVEKGST
jgi:heme-degrading monooxygenase HmoA